MEKVLFTFTNIIGLAVFAILLALLCLSTYVCFDEKKIILGAIGLVVIFIASFGFGYCII